MALRRGIRLMVLAASLVFCNYRVACSDFVNNGIVFAGEKYLEMNTEVGAPCLAGLGRVFRFTRILAHFLQGNVTK